MDTARCLCANAVRYLHCPIHGDSEKDPQKPYVLTVADRTLLHSFRIAITDSAAIQAVREDEERRRR